MSSEPGFNIRVISGAGKGIWPKRLPCVPAREHGNESTTLNQTLNVSTIAQKSRSPLKQNGTMSAVRLHVLGNLPRRRVTACPRSGLRLRVGGVERLHPFCRRKNRFQVENRLRRNVSGVVVIEHLTENDVERRRVVPMAAGVTIPRTTTQITAIRLQLTKLRTDKDQNTPVV